MNEPECHISGERLAHLTFIIYPKSSIKLWFIPKVALEEI
jgi:hypothetical protein